MATTIARISQRVRRRAALGLGPVAAPFLVFIPMGILVGPFGIDLISSDLLAHLDAVVTLALSTLGVFIGVAAGLEGRTVRRLFAASTLEAAVTITVVASALIVLLTAWQLPLGAGATLTALSLAVCAAASSAPVSEHSDTADLQTAARVADLDDVLPIALGAFVIGAAAGAHGPVGGAALAVALGLGVGTCGWLLFERAHSAAERGVFVLGTLALLGGAAAYSGASPLMAGMIAGWFWVVMPGRADRLMADDLRKVQHPLIVLVLITAGASLEPSIAGVWLFAPYVVFRLSGKLLGGWAASRIARGIAPADLGAYLLPPGVIGVAFALNVAQVAPAAAPLVFAVTIGAFACELIALVLTPVPDRA